MATLYPAVPDGCVDTQALLAAVVSFFNGHALIAPWKSAVTMTPKVLQVLEGPRTDAWMLSNAPLMAITFLRDDLEQDASDNFRHGLVFSFQVAIATLGKDPEEADKIALRLSDTVRYCLRGTGALLGQPDLGTGNTVGRAYFTSSGWDIEKRPDPCMALWLKNLAVEVLET